MMKICLIVDQAKNPMVKIVMEMIAMRIVKNRGNFGDFLSVNYFGEENTSKHIKDFNLK